MSVLREYGGVIDLGPALNRTSFWREKGKGTATTSTVAGVIDVIERRSSRPATKAPTNASNEKALFMRTSSGA
jgi:hypothetical protein